MAIRRIDEDHFRYTLAQYLTPARAISSPEHLKGREQKLRQIDRAFNSPGKHIFIYGDRGVGKTSLAQTAAVLKQSSESEPILVACGPSGFLSTVRDAVRRSLPVGDAIFQRKVEEKLRLGTTMFGYEISKGLAQGTVPSIDSINDAILLLRFIAEHSREPVIIFDEFDQLTDLSEQKICADLIKQVSDQAINVRFIICGIGSSLEDLIGVHLSTGRYLSPVHLERLTHDARWEILSGAAAALGVEVKESHLIRVGQISDGFPSYVHLIGEQLLWSVFDDTSAISVCEQSHFEQGVRGAVAEAESTLKIIYDRATQKYSDDYQEVLWALADNILLRRQVSDIYVKSYLPIMKERPDRIELTKEQFYSRMNNLKTERHGSILTGRGAGWYEFRENIVRGYVRLRAESEGIQIGREGYG